MELDYKNKNILAPMVRVGTLAFRLLALEYGADIVYSEEIIDYKMILAKRSVNKLNNTIEYWVAGSQKPIFATNEKEKDQVVFQMGTNNPERALQVCKLIENDVAGIDVNMGCPKDFSVKSGMGSALLTKPELIKEILTTLVNSCSKPITCKIRCLPDLEDTLKLAKMIETTGVKALAVHGRFKHERSSNPPHNDYIRAISDALTIPVIANGGSNTLNKYEEIDIYKKECNVTSAMLARSAMWNASVFRKEGLIPLDDVIKRFLEISIETNNFFFNVKYGLQQMLHKELTSERGEKVLNSLNPNEVYELFGMLKEYKESVQKHSASIDKEITITKRKIDDNENGADIEKVQNNEQNIVIKKLKPDDIKTEILNDTTNDNKVITMHARYIKTKFAARETPKSILHSYSINNKLPRPLYKTEEKKPERVYKSSLEFDNVIYTTPYWEVNKQNTEQAVAIVCLEVLGIQYEKYKTEADKVIS